MTRIALLGVLGTASLLAGFHQPASFEASASDGGGHRMYFDGSPRQNGYDCTACHTGAAQQIGVRIDATPALGPAYQPQARYAITVALTGEHLGFGTANNQNGFVAEIVDDTGAPAGTLATPGDGVIAIDDGRVVAGEGQNATAWRLSWTAPEAGRGPVTLHLAAVDGDGAASATVPQNDPGGDDVAVVRVRMCEAAPGCADRPPPAATESKAAGCSASGSGSLPGAGLAMLGVLVLGRRRGTRRCGRPRTRPAPGARPRSRSDRCARGGAATAIALAVTGCFAPNTPTDCPDHVCGGTAGDAGAGCKESWVCSAWEAPAGSDQATRTCVDQNAAGTTSCRPALTATLPALDLAYYQCQVHPIFQRGCGQLACHGTDTGRPFRIYSRGRLRNNQMVSPVNTCLENPSIKVNLQVRGSGTVMCEGWLPHTPEEWKKNFDSARSFLLDVASPDDSLLLREPTRGGLPHAQVKLFAAGDAEYQIIRRWLAGDKLGTTCNPGKN